VRIAIVQEFKRRN
jgi:hypothetical protein